MASILKIGDRWRAQVRRKGHKSITDTFPTKAAAQAWATKIEAQLADGTKPVIVSDLTVGDMIQIYRGLRDKARPILDTSNEHYMLNHLDEDLGDIKATALTVDDLLGWAQKRADDGAGPYTVNMELGKLGTLLRYAGAAKRLALPDVVGTARPLLSHAGLIGGGGKRLRRPNEDELTRVLEQLAKRRGGIYADAVMVAVLTTMRRSEICRVVWPDLDEAKGVLMIRDRKHPRKKKGNDELIPIVPAAMEIIKRQAESEDGRIFPIHPQTLSKYFKEACDDLGIVDLHLHDMRHEGTSRLFEQEYEIPQVAAFTGHKDWRQLQRYTQLDPAKLVKRPKP